MAGETQILVPAVDVAARSDPGRDPTKQVNEDAFGWRETRLGVLAVVCDGMGGHVGGREASSAALATILESFEGAAPTATPREALRDALRLANVRVRGLVVNEGAGGRPGSTVVAVLVHAGGTEVAHVGDSRVYLVHQGQVFQLTRDHSMVQEMVEAKILTPAQAAIHPEANKITRALGIDDDVDVEVRPQAVPHVVGDAFVLCSDGLSDLVEPSDILQIVANDPPQQAVGRLVDLANARGGHDNITVIVLRPRVSAPAPSGSVAPTLADSQMVTLRPPHESITIPLTPAPRPLERPTTRDEASERPRSAGSATLPLIVLGIAVLAALVIVYARTEHARHHHPRDVPASEVDAEPPPPPIVTAPPTASSVMLAPVEPPDAGEVDASEVTPLAPPSSTPHVRHSRNR